MVMVILGKLRCFSYDHHRKQFVCGETDSIQHHEIVQGIRKYMAWFCFQFISLEFHGKANMIGNNL